MPEKYTEQYKTSSFGRDIYFNGPRTLEEYEERGGAGSCLKDAVAGLIAWDTLPTFQYNLAKELEKVFPNITRNVDEKATAAKRDRAKTEEAKAAAKVLEKDTSFIRRVMASAMSDEDKALFEATWSAAVKATEVDPTPSKRGQRGPGKEFVERAQSFLALDADALEAKVTKILAVVPDFDLERDANGVPSEESLAYAIKAWYQASL